MGKTEEGNLARLLRDNENLLCDVSAGSGNRAFMRDPEYCAKFIEEFFNKMLNNKMISLENYNKFVRLNAEKLLGL